MHWLLDSSNNLSPLDAFPVSLQYGYSVYTTFRWPIEETLLCAHLERLESNAAALGMAFNHSPRQIRDVLDSVVPNDQPVVRLTLGPKLTGYSDLFRSSPGQTLMMLSFRELPPVKETPLKLKAVIYQRQMSHIKHGSMLDAILLRQEALTDGFDDVLFVNSQGHVSEASTSNVVAIRNGGFQIPEPHRDGCLPGITVQSVRTFAGPRDIPVSKEALTLADLKQSDGVFLTNAVSGIQAVGQIDKDAIQWTDAAQNLLGELKNLV